MLNLGRTCVLLFYYFLCLKVNLNLEKTNQLGESSPYFISAVVNLDPIVLEKRWTDGESWPNDSVAKVNRGEDLRWLGSRCPLTHALRHQHWEITNCLEPLHKKNRYFQCDVIAPYSCDAKFCYFISTPGNETEKCFSWKLVKTHIRPYCIQPTIWFCNCSLSSNIVYLPTHFPWSHVAFHHQGHVLGWLCKLLAIVQHLGCC